MRAAYKSFDFAPALDCDLVIPLIKGDVTGDGRLTERVRFLRAGFVTPPPGGLGIEPAGTMTGAWRIYLRPWTSSGMFFRNSEFLAQKMTKSNFYGTHFQLRISLFLPKIPHRKFLQFLSERASHTRPH